MSCTVRSLYGPDKPRPSEDWFTTVILPRKNNKNKNKKKKKKNSKQTRLEGFHSPSEDPNVTWGDRLASPKESSIFRVYQLNANGVSIDAENNSLRDLAQSADELDIDFLGIQEHRLNVSKVSVKQALATTTKSLSSQSKAVFSNSPLPYKGVHQYGGTGFIASGPSLGRFLSTGHDRFGRWTYSRLSGKNRKITVVSAYQVCQVSEQNGLKQPNSTWAQQFSLLNSTEPKKILPRPAFRRDLRLFLQKEIDNGSELILMGDFNESLIPTSDLYGMISDLQLRSALQYRHGDHHSFPTHMNGSKCIDFIFVSQNLLTSITACGISSFGEHFRSDHRGVFVDFQSSTLFQSPTHRLSRPKTRGFSTSNPLQVTKYLDHSREYMLQHRMLERAYRLDAVNTPSSELVEALDRDISRMCKAVERRMSRPALSDWNIKYQRTLTATLLLRRLIGLYKRKKTIPRCLCSKLERYSDLIGPNPPTDLTSSRHCLSTLEPLLSDAIAHRKEHRQQMLTELQEAHSRAHNVDSERAIHQLKAKETSRSNWAGVKQVFASERRGITTIQVPNPNPTVDDEWITVDLPNEVESHLINRNRAHFGQAQGTPFTVPPLSDDFDWAGSSASADLVLQGNYPLDGLPTPVQDILRELTRPAKVQEMPSLISDSTFRRRIRRWKESTMTSPSGRHLGHYKVCVAKHDCSKPKPLKKDEIPTLEWVAQRKRHEAAVWTQRALQRCYISVLNYCLRFGYSLSRWQSITNIMIPKEQGNNRISRLRVIHIYEADYNLAMAAKWGEMVANAERNKLLSPAQFGGHKSRTAYDPVLIEELENEILRLSRHPIARMDNDATACYDRIIMNLASLASRWAGGQVSVTSTCAETLRKAVFRLLTALGISTEFYKHCADHPIHGSGQGSGNSPPLWLLISSLLLRIHFKKAHGAKFATPLGHFAIRLSMLGFVDDVSNRCNTMWDNIHLSADQLAKLLADDCQLWNDLLGASGGAMNLSKCPYHLCVPDFACNGAPFLASLAHQRVHLSDTTSSTVQAIQYLPPQTTHKTLGFLKAPSGNQKAQYDALLERSRLLTDQVTQSSVQGMSAELIYRFVFIKSVGYRLSLTCLSASQWLAIQKPFLWNILSRMGFSRTHPRAALFGPQSHGGYGLPNLPTMSGPALVVLFLSQWQQRLSYTGKMLRVAVGWFQFAAGVSWPVFFYPDRPLPYLESQWLVTLRKFLASQKCSLRLRDSSVMPRQRRRDRHLMDLAASYCSTEAELYHVQLCRLYLGVTLLSDITSSNGRYILKAAIHGQRTDLPSIPIGVSAIQQNPPPEAWKRWGLFLLSLTDPSDRLLQPLGDWFPGSLLQTRRWRWYFSPSHCLLFQAVGLRFHVFSRRAHRPGRFSMRPSATTISLPSDCVPLDAVGQSPPSWILPSRICFQAIFAPPPDRRLRTIVPRLLHSAVWKALLHRYTKQCVDQSSLLSILRSRKDLFLATRPNLNGTRCTCAGWSFGTVDTILATGYFRSDSPKPSNRLRLEGLGLLMGLTFIQEACCAAGVSTLTDRLSMHTHHCHCEQVCIFFTMSHLPDHKRPGVFCDWALFTTLEEYRRRLDVAPPGFTRPIKEYPPGYFSDTDYDDGGAKHLSVAWGGSIRGSRLVPSSLLPLFPASSGDLVVAHSFTPTGNLRSFLEDRGTYPEYKKYVQEKFDLDDTCWRLINWRALEVALYRRRDNRVHFHKMIHDWLPLGPRLQMYDPTVSALCPLCKGEKETFQHLLWCPQAQVWRDNMAFDFQNYVENPGPEDLAQYLWSVLATLLKGDLPPPPDEFTEPDLYRIWHAQNTIGWPQLFWGRWAKAWDEVAVPNTWRRSRVYRRFSYTWILFLWKHWELLWHMRNEALHGSEHNDDTQFAAVKDEVTFLYSLRDKVEPHLSHIFYDSVDEHCQVVSFQASRLTTWATTYSSLIWSSVQRRQGRSRASPSILEFFPLVGNSRALPAHTARPPGRRLRPTGRIQRIRRLLSR